MNKAKGDFAGVEGNVEELLRMPGRDSETSNDVEG